MTQPVPECRHIKTSGGKCGSPALLGQPFCYFHSHMKQRASRLPHPYLALELPPLEDRGSIQLAISEVARALADNRIDSKRAGVLLYALQIASSNARNQEEIVSSSSVAEVTRSEDGQEMAPEGSKVPRPGVNNGEPTLADLLLAEVRRQRQLEEHPEPDPELEDSEDFEEE